MQGAISRVLGQRWRISLLDGPIKCTRREGPISRRIPRPTTQCSPPYRKRNEHERSAMVLSSLKSRFGNRTSVAAYPAEAPGSTSESDVSVLRDGDLAFVRERGGNASGPSYQEAAGAPVESKSPLGYNVGWLTVIFLNVNQMIGTGIFSTRTYKPQRRIASNLRARVCTDGRWLTLSQPGRSSQARAPSAWPSSTGPSASSWPSRASACISSSPASSPTAAAPRWSTSSRPTRARATSSPSPLPCSPPSCPLAPATPLVRYPSHKGLPCDYAR